MRGYTSIEQSKKLLELGLDPETADMVYPAWTLSDTPTEDIVNIRRHDYENDNDVPCWSLATLLELVSYKIDIDDKQWYVCCIGRTENEYLIFYSNVNNGNMLCQFKSEEFVDAAVEMVLWLLENGYIEKK